MEEERAERRKGRECRRKEGQKKEGLKRWLSE